MHSIACRSNHSVGVRARLSPPSAQHLARNFPRSVDLVPRYSLADDARSSRNILLFVNIDSRFLFIPFLLYSTLLAFAEISSLRVLTLRSVMIKRRTKRNEFALSTCILSTLSRSIGLKWVRWIIKRREINQFNSVTVWVCFS